MEGFEKVTTRKIIQRGPSGASTVLPNRYMEDNELYRGSPMVTGCSQDYKKLFIVVKGRPITFTREIVIPIKEYGMGIHCIKSEKRNHTYPIITIPQKWMEENNLKPGDSIDIFRTPQKDCLVIVPTQS